MNWVGVKYNNEQIDVQSVRTLCGVCERGPCTQLYSETADAGTHAWVWMFV